MRETVAGALATTLIATGSLAARQPGLLLAALAALAGLLLGTRGMAAVVAGAVLPYVLALPFALWRLPQSRRRDLPFGPFLATGALAGALAGNG